MAQAPLDWLLGLGQFGIKFGLENMRAITGALQHPERSFTSVHVAGTNGKGSVTAIVETALRLAGLRTGRYTSPHLVHLTERFAIDGTPVTVADLASAVDTVRAAVLDLQAQHVLEVHPTFFEVTTEVAFELFRRQRVDVAVCEVGLGGRLDATNVLAPLACAITSIGFDHQQYLGHTLQEIAREKAGIIKPGTPVVVGAVDPAAAEAIAATAQEAGAPIVWAHSGVRVGGIRTGERGGQQFQLSTPRHDYGEVSLALSGEHQVHNAVVAVRLLEELETRGLPVRPSHVAGALSEVKWPGRLEHVDLGDGRSLLLDAAHNEAGAAALAAYLTGLGRPRPLVFAAMRDKDAEAMLRALLPVVGEVVVTRASNPRSSEPAALAELVARLDRSRPVHVVDAVSDAVALALTRGPHIVVAGSIFLLGDVMNALGRS